MSVQSNNSTEQPKNLEELFNTLFTNIAALAPEIEFSHQKISELCQKMNAQNEFINGLKIQIFKQHEMLEEQAKMIRSLSERLVETEGTVAKLALNSSMQGTALEILGLRQIPKEQLAEIMEKRESELQKLNKLQQAYMQSVLESTPTGLTYTPSSSSSSSLTYTPSSSSSSNELSIIISEKSPSFENNEIKTPAANETDRVSDETQLIPEQVVDRDDYLEQLAVSDEGFKKFLQEQALSAKEQ